MEWLCVHGTRHGEFVSADDDNFDSRCLRGDQLERAGRAPSRFGYCDHCKAAMRWDINRQLLVDWPEGNIVPHCAYCRKPMVYGQHHLTATIDLTTFVGPYLPQREPPRLPPAIDKVDVCGPACMLQVLLDNERIADVYNR